MLNPFSPHPGSHLHGQYGGSIGGPTPSFQYRPHKVVQTVYDPTDDFEIMSKAPIDEFYPETKEPAKSVGRPLRSNVLLSRDNTPSPVHGDHEGETVSKYIYMNGPGASPRSIRNTSTWEKVKTDPAYGIMLDNRKQMSMAELRIRSRERAVPHSRHVSVKPELNGDSRGQHGTNASTPAPVPLRKHDSTKVLLEKLQARGVARITSINGKRVAEDEAEQVKTKAAKIEQESASPEQRKKALTDHVTNGETPKQVLMEKTAAWIQAQNTEPNGLGHDITSAATPSPAPVPDPTPDTAAENVDTEAAAEAANGVVPKNQIVLVETKTAKGRKKNALVKQKEDEEEKQLIKEEAMITRAKAKRKAAAPKVEAAYK